MLNLSGVMFGIRKTFQVLLDILEKVVPILSFAALFIVFILQIFYRYFLQTPLTWPFELTQICYVWTIFFGAALVTREDEHIVFSVVYEKLNERTKACFRLIGAVLTTVFFSISVVPTIRYFRFLKTRLTNVLDIQFSIAFLPYLVFLVLAIIHSVRVVIISSKLLGGPRRNQAIARENR